MRKFLFLLVIIGLIIVAHNYIVEQRQVLYSLDLKANDKSTTVGGYVISWDDNFIYLYISETKEKKIKFSSTTNFLRTYIKSDKILVKQEKIGMEDLIKDQYIEVDGFKSGDIIEALVIRQIIYLDENF